MAKPNIAPAGIHETDDERLRWAWAEAKRRHPRKRFGHKELAAEAAVNKSFISLMVNGRSPINTEWKLRIARYLDIPVAEIWPDFEFRDMYAADLSPEAIRIARAFETSKEPHVRSAITQLLTPSIPKS